MRTKKSRIILVIIIVIVLSDNFSVYSLFWNLLPTVIIIISSSRSVSIIIITIINILESAKQFVNLRTMAVVVSVSSYMFIILFTLKKSLVCYM